MGINSRVEGRVKQLKKYFKIIPVFLFSILILSFSIKKEWNCSIVKSFQKTGAELISYEVEGYAKLKTSLKNDEVARKICENINISNYSPTLTDPSETIIECKKNNIKYIIKTKNIDNNGEIYASVAMSQEKDLENINNIRKIISECFKTFNVKPSYSTLVCGKFDRCMNLKEMEYKSRKVFDGFSCHIVDEYCYQNMVSTCGYVHGIKEKLNYGNEYINVNAALRTSKSYDCTYIWIGSPIISVEY